MTIKISRKFRKRILFFSLFVLLPFSFVQAHLKPNPDSYLVVFEKGSSWDKSQSYKKQKNIGAHIQYWKTVYHDNKISVGGVFKDSQLAFYIVKESDEKKLKAIIDKDPLVASKVLSAKIEKTIVTMKEKKADGHDHDHGHSH